MESRITVLAAERQERLYASKVPGGLPKTVVKHVCKAMFLMDGGVLEVGTISVPDALAPEGVQPGDYMVSYKVGRGYTDDKMVGVMCEFRPVRPGVHLPGATVPAAPAPAETKAK